MRRWDMANLRLRERSNAGQVSLLDFRFPVRFLLVLILVSLLVVAWISYQEGRRKRLAGNLPNQPRV